MIILSTMGRIVVPVMVLVMRRNAVTHAMTSSVHMKESLGNSPASYQYYNVQTISLKI